jgi:hypothetical protein
LTKNNKTAIPHHSVSPNEVKNVGPHFDTTEVIEAVLNILAQQDPQDEF